MDASSSDSFVFTLPADARVVNGVKIADLSGAGLALAAVPVVSKSANFNAEALTHYEVDATATPVVVTLPASADHTGESLTIARVDASANTLTLSSTDTINGDATVDVEFQNSAITVRSVGTMWRII